MAASSSTFGRELEPARVPRYWQALILVLGLLVLAHMSLWIWEALNGYPGEGRVGVLQQEAGPDGFWRIVKVEPGSPLATAGARPGDAIRYDRAADAVRQFRAGESVGLTLRHEAALSHYTLTAAPRSIPANELAQDQAERRLAIVICSAWMVPALIGLLVTLRSRGRTSVVLLGAALVGLGLTYTNPNLLEGASWIGTAIYCGGDLMQFAPPVLFLAFALAARRETRSKLPRRWLIALGAYTLVVAMLAGRVVWVDLTGRSLVLTHSMGVTVWTTTAGIGLLLTVLALGAAWRESVGMDRTRYAFMLAAIGLLSSLQFVGALIYATGNQWTTANPLVLMLLGAPILGASVFAYAVLRHRVVDIGFAVNRTLVYGAVSAALLATFGLVEWAVDHFVSIGGREKNVLVDAAVAVGIFLAFHRVRDWVEHLIESLFFSNWKKAEERLRRFVKEAPFFIEASTLTAAFVRTLSQYAGGAETAVYVKDGHGYTRAAGGIADSPAVLDGDLPTLVSVRATLEPIEAPDGVLAGCLVTPMVNRNEVIGLTVVGPKPSAHVFRPDEIELIGWATRQIGLDMHALEIEQLQAQNAQIAPLQRENAMLHALVAQRA
ncbi:hypothetical protein DVT68_16225 [Dyella solisilvae]|uniref:GAF domain-containing protein n=1 Tax=Dyella solisilvae TaxID=1920168 RepID=A0A370K3U6_9GAMM|nr:hypothetical protein [Dyella solisilvae]RDI97312.1 hypothetical protein DVT68_16225 [Dyella solisilvae]